MFVRFEGSRFHIRGARANDTGPLVPSADLCGSNVNSRIVPASFRFEGARVRPTLRRAGEVRRSV